MTDEKARSPEDPTEEELDRQAILARRKRFIGAALLGLASAAAVACSDAIETPAGDAGTTDAAADATPQPCLSPVVPRRTQAATRARTRAPTRLLNPA
jgi:hypothetical protein